MSAHYQPRCAMKDGRRFSSSTLQDGWGRSLRRETALQDEYRRAICIESGCVASDTGFDRCETPLDAGTRTEHVVSALLR